MTIPASAKEPSSPSVFIGDPCYFSNRGRSPPVAYLNNYNPGCYYSDRGKTLYSQTTKHNTLISCPDCDLLLSGRAAPVSHTLLCPRCGKTIGKRTANSVLKTLVLSLTGLLMYFPAIILPLMTFESFGFSDSANILESIVNLFLNDYFVVAIMVAISAVLFPFVLLTAIFIVSLQLHKKRYPPYLTTLFRLYIHLEEWAMIEVYLLGIMITIIKMVDTTEIIYHSGIFCFSALVVATLAISTVIDKRFFWYTIEHKDQTHSANKPDSPADKDNINTTAAEAGLILCHTCHKLSPISLEDKGCPRCSGKLHIRKANTISRTWALVITSMIFLLPANLLPIMEVDILGIPERSTILDGIIYFFQHDSYLIGLIIFTASILVPVFKVTGLIILLLTSRPSAPRFLREKTQMYRFIAFIGRWSMLDIFVIAILTVLVDFGFLTSIHAAPAATYFCIVVAATMLAAITFDPRVMWDKCGSRSKQHHKTSSFQKE